jgi:tetratricopeptide (TPR) repeat protein
MEEYTNSFEEEGRHLAERYERLSKNNSHFFFDADEFENLIEHYIQLGNLKRAGIVIAQAFQQYPYSASFMIKKAHLLYLEGGKKDAMALLEKAMIYEPGNPEIYQQIGAIYDESEEYALAIEYYDRAIAFGLNSEELIISKAYVYENWGKFEEAVICLNESLEQNPENYNAIYELAYCYDYLELPEKSIALYLKYIDRNPYSVHAWFNLGLLYARIEKYEEALQAYEFASFSDKKFSPAFSNMGNVYVILENYTLAIDAFKDALALEPENSQLHCQLGNCYKFIDNYEVARTYFRKALALDDKNAEGWLGMGLSYYYEDNYILALQNLKKAVKLSPEEDNHWSNLGHCALSMDDYDLAQQAYTKAYGLDPKNIENLKDFVYILYLNDMPDEAMGIMKEGLALWGNHPDLLAMNAGLLYESGHKAKADDFLEFALTLDPGADKILFEYFWELEENEHVLLLIARYRAR